MFFFIYLLECLYIRQSHKFQHFTQNNSFINHSLTIFLNLRNDTLYFRKNFHYLILIINRYIYIKFTSQIYKNTFNMILSMVD